MGNLAKCLDCGHEFASNRPTNKLQCGKCNSVNVTYISDESIKSTRGHPSLAGNKPSKRSLVLNKYISLQPGTTAIIEKLIGQKIYNDPDEAVNKSIETIGMLTKNTKFMNYILGGDVKMPEENPDPKKELEKMQTNDLIEAQIQKKKAESEALLKKVKAGEAAPNELLSMMKEQLALKQYASMLKEMNKGSKGEDSNPVKEMKEMMLMQVYSNMMMPGQHSGNGESLELKRKVEELERNIRDQKIFSEIKKIAEKGQNKGLGTEDYLKLFADKQAAVEKEKLNTEKAKSDAQIEKEKRLDSEKLAQIEKMHGAIASLEKKLGDKKTPIDEIKRIKEEITAYKEIAKELGEQKETSKGEVATKLIQTTIDKLSGPISTYLQEKARASQEKAAKDFSQHQMPLMYPPPPMSPSSESVSQVEVGPEAPLQEEMPQPIEEPEVIYPEDQIVDTMDGQNTTKHSAESNK